MATVVEFLSNGRRRGRRRRRKMTAAQRRFFGPRRGKKNPSRRRSSGRRSRRNPSTFVSVPAPVRFENRSRRRRRRRRGFPNQGISVTRMTNLLGPATLGALTALSGWIGAKTFLKEKDTGLMGVAANAAGSILFATVASATIAKRSPSLRMGIWLGAIMGPAIRFGVDALRGRQLPLGLRSGFEGASPMTLGDFFTTRPMIQAGFQDFLAPRRSLSQSGFGYAEAGSTWADMR